MADLSSTKIYGRLTVIHDAILKANASITGNVNVSGDVTAANGTFSNVVSASSVTLTGDIAADTATITNALSAGTLSASSATLTGNLGVVDVNASGNLFAVNTTLTGNLSVVDINGANITLTGNIGVVDVNASGNVNATNATLTGDLGVVDVNASGIVSGNGSGLTNVNAETLDGLDSTSYVRSDVDDEVLGKITFRDSPNVDTDSNLKPFKISRQGVTTSEVLNIGVEDTAAVFEYIEDDAETSPGNFIFRVKQESGIVTNDFTISDVAGVASINGSDIWTTGNDGPGSGLDADTIDGIEGSQIVRNDQDNTIMGNQTIDGNMIVDGGSNAVQVRSDGVVDHAYMSFYPRDAARTTRAGYIGYSSGGSDILSISNQIGEIYLISTGQAYINSNQIWHAGNHGTGSGLDADTLDGIQGSQYLRNDQSGTISGNLTLTGDLTLGSQQGVVVDFVSGAKNPVFVMKGYEDFGLFWKEGSPDTFQISTTGELTDFALEINREGLTRKGFTVWDSGNHGPGSGLDADTLDGKQLTTIEQDAESAALALAIALG